MTDFILKYWIEFIFGIIAAALGWAYRQMANKMKKAKIEQDAIRSGVKGLLRDRIIQAYIHYTEKASCPIYALENVEQLYNEYKSLDGNGAVKTLVEKLRELPH